MTHLETQFQLNNTRNYHLYAGTPKQQQTALIAALISIIIITVSLVAVTGMCLIPNMPDIIYRTAGKLFAEVNLVVWQYAFQPLN